MYIFGTIKRDYLKGTSDGDAIYGFDGNDTLLGLGGDDVLIGGAGADLVYGGGGRDTASYWDSAAGVIVDLDLGTGRFGTAEGDQLFDIEVLYGSEFDDELCGDNADNDLNGGGGMDWLYGRNGNDHLAGGYDNDYLVGGIGADVLDGAEGNYDTASYYLASAPVSASLMRGVGFGGEADGDVYLSIEVLHGSSYDDFLEGDNRPNNLSGEGGNDLLYGWGGNDGIAGGMGLDVLGGGAGLDLFEWMRVEETGITLATADWVADFDAADDRIGLHQIDADETVAGNQDFRFIGNAEFSAPGQVRFTIEGGDTVVRLNTRGDLADDAVIVLQGVHELTAGNFYL